MSDPATSPAIIPRLRWTWDFGAVLGELEAARLLSLLSALETAGSLRPAAAMTGMSYRAAWGLLHHGETVLGTALVVKQRGRGTTLSPLGEAIMRLDAAARLALGEAHAPWERRLRELLSPALGERPRLRLAASHDLALADWIENGRRIDFDRVWRGSEEALTALAKDQADIAGFHLPEAWSAAQLTAWLGRWLKPRLHVCIPVMRRRQGLIVAAGNPLRLHSLADVPRRGARLVNRQRGSATRGLIDQLLAANGWRPEDVSGYAHEEFTHEAVAATVASGQADAGFGIEAAAARYDLGFVPLIWERYGFAMRGSVAASAEGKRFLARVFGNTFRQRLLAMPGYQPMALRADGNWEAFLADADS